MTTTPAPTGARRALKIAYCFAVRFLPDLIGWTFTLFVLGAIAFGYGHETWFTVALGVLAVTWGVLVGAPGAVDFVGQWRYRKTLLDLADMGREHHDHTSGVWMITAPHGYEEWELYAPGQCHPGAAFPLRDITPTATRCAVEPGPARERDTDAPQGIEQIREWATPWVEAVSGGRVVEMLHGWGPPYGAERNLYEVSIYARVASRQESAS